MEFKNFTNEKDWIEASVQFLANNVSEGGKVALSGGNTPAPVYKSLAEKHADLARSLDFYVVDERYVPNTDEKSNYKKIVDALGREVKNFDTSKEIRDSLHEYEMLLMPTIPFDIVVLGMGPDGHIASLFPKGSALTETERLVANTHTYEFDVYERLTLTFPAIMSAKKLLLLLSGKKKKEVLDHLINKEFIEEDFPAKRLLQHNDLTIHFGDY